MNLASVRKTKSRLTRTNGITRTGGFPVCLPLPETFCANGYRQTQRFACPRGLYWRFAMWRFHPSDWRLIPFRRAILILPVVFAVVCAVVFAAPSRRVRFAPKFVEGESRLYPKDMRTVSTGNTTTPIANPEGETKVSQTISLLARLDVLGAANQGTLASGQSRLRATYEKSRAQSESDALNPDAPSLEDQYAKLEGGSIEFTLMPDGHLANITGLEDLFPNRSQTDPILSWISALSTGNSIPGNGIALGQKWSDERSLEGWPLTGLSWRTESTYLRDDVCAQAGAITGEQPETKGAPGSCAVLLTRFEIVHRGSSQADATPDDYRRNGLRTSGTWTGSGESLNTISLATGLLESATQTSTQNMDYQITSASSGSRIHHVGQVQSQSEIRLVSGPSGSIQ